MRKSARGAPSLSFRPIDLYDVGILRKLLALIGPIVAFLSRAIWLVSGAWRSTCAEQSTLWGLLWNLNRYVSLLPRSRSFEITCDVGLGLRMLLDLSRLTDCFAYAFGIGENEIRWIALQACKRDSTILDIGANIGTTTLVFAHLAQEGMVHAFEPAAGMHKSLLTNVVLNEISNVRIYPFGLGDQPSKGHLEIAMVGNPGSAFFVEDPAGVETEAELRRLDDVMSDEKRVDLIKLDVEGFEYNVLKGGLNILQRDHPVIAFEVNLPALARYHQSVDSVLALLESVGYEFFVINHGLFVPYDPAHYVGIHNVVAVHSQGVWHPSLPQSRKGFPQRSPAAISTSAER